MDTTSLTTPCGRTCPINCSTSHSTSSTFALLVKDPQHVYGIPNSSARQSGLHRFHVDGMRIANLSAERTTEVCSFVRSWESRFLVSTSVSLSGPPPRPCFASRSGVRMVWIVAQRKSALPKDKLDALFGQASRIRSVGMVKFPGAVGARSLSALPCGGWCRKICSLRSPVHLRASRACESHEGDEDASRGSPSAKGVQPETWADAEVVSVDEREEVRVKPPRPMPQTERQQMPPEALQEMLLGRKAAIG